MVSLKVNGDIAQMEDHTVTGLEVPLEPGQLMCGIVDN